MKNIKIGIVVFPGTNCNIETKKSFEIVGFDAIYIWHEEKKISKDIKAFVIPGGFSYGDYLEAGKIASFSPVMQEIKERIYEGVPVLGICNGFQILCMSGIFECALLMNKNGKFISRWVFLQVENDQTPFTCYMKKGDIIKLPIAHKFGNFFYRNKNGFIPTFKYIENPNGSMDDIAGISNPARNVVALMPHPERAIRPELGSEDGLKIFLSLKKWFSL